MKKYILLTVLMVGFCLHVYSQTTEYQKAMDYLQKKGEVYFKFNVNSKDELKYLTNILSIDNVNNLEVLAYANANQFQKFNELNYGYTILTHPGDEILLPKMFTSGIKSAYNYDSYPTYDSYIALMNQFAADYPNLCRIIEIGTTVKGRKLLFAKISNNVNNSEPEPRVMYTSTIHGDETTGYILMLRLINYLLSNYGGNTEVTNLVNNLEIWINPLANPDGTYAGGNSTVSGARRYNANYIDLNRNFPDPEDRQHPDGNVWQPETQAFMNLANSYHFVMAANFHGGAEVLNYPWDTWQARHADDNWYQYIGHKYTNEAHANSPAGYMGGFDSGITNGYDWYEVNGGRQDYMNYYNHCREVTIELSNTKLLPESQLGNLWNYNYKSLLAYIGNALSGIKGKVTDGITNQPIEAEIFVNNHDKDNSHVYSNSTLGDFYRPVYEGSYEIVASSAGYISRSYMIDIKNGESKTLNISLFKNCDESISITANLVGGTHEFLANNTITASNTISGGATVHYGANSSVKMTTGFKVYAGNNFSANLNGCAVAMKSTLSETTKSMGTGLTKGQSSSETKVNDMPLDNRNVSVYPNPTNGKLFVEGLTCYEANVYDLSGRLLLNMTKANGNIDISDFKPGIYTIHLRSKGKTYIYKVFKQ